MEQPAAPESPGATCAEAGVPSCVGSEASWDATFLHKVRVAQAHCASPV